MHFSHAHTIPINPRNTPSSDATLSKSDIWAALVSKARRPQDYIPLIAECTVVSESAGGLARDIKFHPGSFMPAGEVLREEVCWVEGVRVDFTIREPGPYQISNILSQGDADDELYLTFTFEFDKPLLEPGSPDATAIEVALRRGAAESVRGFVGGVRRRLLAEQSASSES